MKKGIIGGLIGLLSGILIAEIYIKKLLHSLSEEFWEKEKYVGYFMIMDDWLAMKEENIRLEQFFKRYHYGTVAIYGMGRLGNLLYDELAHSDIKVKYGIDQTGGRMYRNLEIISKDGKLEPVDAIIVTAVFDFDSIKDELKKRVDCPVISLEEVIYPLCRRV